MKTNYLIFLLIFLSACTDDVSICIDRKNHDFLTVVVVYEFTHEQDQILYYDHFVMLNGCANFGHHYYTDVQNYIDTTRLSPIGILYFLNYREDYFDKILRYETVNALYENIHHSLRLYGKSMDQLELKDVTLFMDGEVMPLHY